MTPMNFVEAVEFMRTVTGHRHDFGELPKLQLYNAEKEGYVVWIKTELINKEFLGFLAHIAETCRLRLRRFEDFLTVSSY